MENEYTRDFADYADEEHTAERIEKLHVERHEAQLQIWANWLFSHKPKDWANWVVDEQLRRVGLL